MLIKNTGADTIEVSNPALADCPPMKGAETMLRHSGTNFNRPSWGELLERIGSGEVSTLIVKTYKQSYKCKKNCYNPEEKWLVFENTHEAIIDADTWAQAQEELREKLLRLNEEINEQEEQSENISNTVL